MIIKKDSNEKVINQEIKANLLRDDASQSYVTSPTVSSSDILLCNNSSDHTEFVRESPDAISSHLCIFFKMNHTLMIILSSDESKITGYFCSDSIFNLSNWVLSEDEIKVLKKD